MRMKRKHYKAVESSINNFLRGDDGARQISRNYASKIISATRFRWDLYHLSVSQYLKDILYNYLNDNHIDTALKKITNTK